MKHVAVAELELGRRQQEEPVAESIEKPLTPLAENFLRNRHIK
jgi:hypothetical protein